MATKSQNPIAYLYQLSMQRDIERPEFIQKSETGPAHEKTFTFECKFRWHKEQRTANSKKAAKTLAAEAVIAKLEEDLLPEEPTYQAKLEAKMKKENIKEEMKKEAKTEIRNPNLYNLSRSNRDLIRSNPTENLKFIQGSDLKSCGEQFGGDQLRDTSSDFQQRPHSPDRSSEYSGSLRSRRRASPSSSSSSSPSRRSRSPARRIKKSHYSRTLAYASPSSSTSSSDPPRRRRTPPRRRSRSRSPPRRRPRSISPRKRSRSRSPRKRSRSRSWSWSSPPRRRPRSRSPRKRSRSRSPCSPPRGIPLWPSPKRSNYEERWGHCDRITQPEHPSEPQPEPTPPTRPPASVPVTNTNKTAKDFSKDEREAIVAQVTEELISPTELSQRHGISVSDIRGWVKTAGKNLPPFLPLFHLHRITQPEPPSEPPPPTRPPASRRDPRLNKNATTSTGMPPKIFVRKDLFENSSKPQPEVPVPHALKVPPPQQNLGNIGIEEADVQINPNDYVFEIDTTKIKLEIKTEVKVEKE